MISYMALRVARSVVCYVYVHRYINGMRTNVTLSLKVHVVAIEKVS